ncbi:MAG: hypothetical protein HFH72_16805 [Lachnospiraceae bacterium]|nr:hypothetical protein [Lachnospiraceae bacterium]
MNKTENIFNETVKTLTEDAMSLQQKFHKLQEDNNIKGSIDCLRLLKDTLSLIREYDWHLEYSEYKTDGKKQVAVWEQNHCGDIKNHKVWNVSTSSENDKNIWYFMFNDAITSGQSLLSSNGYLHRNSGKSYALANLCHEYEGFVVYKNVNSVCGIENRDKELDITNMFVPYKRGRMNSSELYGKVIFIDEGSGLNEDEIEELKKNHIVVGFKDY